MNALLKAMIGDLLRDLNILNQSLSLISVDLSGINLKLEAESINNLDLGGRKGVKLGHSLNFNELNEVTILKLVAFIFVNSNYARIGLGRCNNNE